MFNKNFMDKIEELLTRGVEKIYPSKEELDKVLRSGRKLKLYQGFDPTGIQLHIGHMVGLRKLRQWQDLGHHVIFLIGDGTGQAGDPSGKTKPREKFFTREELRKNATNYVKQASKIVRFKGENPVEILFNGDWLNKLGYTEILELLGHVSLQQLEERDLFEERKKKGEDIIMREFIYPVLQGYDSVAMNVDLEIGGSDQTFNMLMGRKLMRHLLKKDKFVMTTPLLADSRGVKIGKTEGNAIALTDKPEYLFGKIMALPDDVILKGFEYLTDVPMQDIKKMKGQLEKGENPIGFKKQLALEIVKRLNTEEEARKAQENFEKTVQQKEIPSEIEIFMLPQSLKSAATISDVVFASGLAESKSEAKRVIEQGGLKINNKIVKNPNSLLSLYLKENELTIQRGTRKFVKITSK